MPITVCLASHTFYLISVSFVTDYLAVSAKGTHHALYMGLYCGYWMNTILGEPDLFVLLVAGCAVVEIYTLLYCVLT